MEKSRVKGQIYNTLEQKLEVSLKKKEFINSRYCRFWYGNRKKGRLINHTLCSKKTECNIMQQKVENDSNLKRFSLICLCCVLLNI